MSAMPVARYLKGSTKELKLNGADIAVTSTGMPNLATSMAICIHIGPATMSMSCREAKDLGAALIEAASFYEAQEAKKAAAEVTL